METFRRSIHQGHHSIDIDSRQRQYPFIILSALLCNHSFPAKCWTSEKMDEIIHFGTSMYSHAFTSGSIPNTSSLLVSYLPVVAMSFHSSLLTIKYEHEYAGFFSASFVPWPSMYSLSDALRNVFADSNNAILLLDGCMRAIFKNESHYFMFDSYKLDRFEISVLAESRTAFLLHFSTQYELEAHICAIGKKIRTIKFAIVPVKISECSVQSNNCKLVEIQQRDLVSENAEVCKDAFIDRRHKQIEYTDKNEKRANCNKTNLEQKLTGLHEQRENKIPGNFNYEQFSEPKSGTNIPDCNTQNVKSPEVYVLESVSDQNRPVKVVRASIHQGHPKLGTNSRGRQCSFIILSAILCNYELPARYWTPVHVDQTIYFGDNMYLHALNCGTIPNTSSLLVSQLPVVAKSFNNNTLLTVKYGNEYSGFFDTLVVS